MRRENVFLGLVGAMLAYEVYALRTECEGDTISEIIWATTTKRPLLPFAFGLLMGHFFWQRAESAPPPRAPLPL